MGDDCAGFSGRSIAWAMLAVAMAAVHVAAQTPSQAPEICVEQMVRMSCEDLEQLYRNGAAPAEVPEGRIRGVALVAPGSSLSPSLSKASRIMWQGKVFDSCAGTASNRFFGLRAVRAQVCAGESWMDGKPALILDYRRSSLVYGDVRDEIRQVAPNLYLGAMYEEGRCRPKFKMFFVLEASPCCR